MPTLAHDIIGELFRENPAFAAELLALRGIHLPHFDGARCESVDFADVKTGAYAADAAVALTIRRSDLVPNQRVPDQRRRRQPAPHDPGDPAVLGVVLETQRETAEEKLASWPIYVTTFRARINAPVALIVICFTDQVARWAAQPIPVGVPDFTLTPLVVGPGDIPLVTDIAQAEQHPQLAILSARAHGNSPHAAPVLKAATAALRTATEDRAKLYYDLLLDALEPETAQIFKELRTVTAVVRNDPRASVLRQWIEGAQAEGEARGEARAVLGVLAARGIDVPDDIRDLVLSCTDVEQLDVWIRRAATAESAKDLLE